VQVINFLPKKRQKWRIIGRRHVDRRQKIYKNKIYKKNPDEKFSWQTKEQKEAGNQKIKE
jgi:hypothetical protein